MHGCVHVIKHVLNVCVTEGPPGSWVWWAGGGVAKERAGGRELFSH